MKRILVTGAGGPAGVNFLKSLKLDDQKRVLYGTDINKYHLQFANPWTEKMFLVPRADSKEYIPSINRIINKYDIDLLHPQPDVEVSVISENREKIDTLTFLPKKETVRCCQDKYLSSNIWKEKMFPSVRALEIRSDNLESDIEKAFNELGKKLWIRAKKGAGGTGSTPVENLETAINWIMYWKSRGKGWEFIAQEYLPGRNIAFQSIFNNGELICSQARERIEYIYPYLAPSGITGTPIVAKTIHNDTVNEMATQAILTIDSAATGIFCVDMKEDKNGMICPTEINAGRFFTTSYFFSYAGKKYDIPLANMPSILTKLAFGEKIPNGPKYNILPKNLYWIRHIDCSEHLVEEKDLNL
jgi:carbamoyl-phosphate synthase large subunit